MIKINTSYGQAITSEMLNEKVSSVTGGNIKLDGFDVKKIDNSIIIGPGKCIISGAIIECTEKKILEWSNYENTIFVKIKYFHREKRIEYVITDNSELLADELIIGSISIENSTLNILNTKRVDTLSKLSRAYKSLRDNLLSEQELKFSGEEIKCSSSVKGNTGDFKIDGNTVLNLSPIKDKTPIFPTLSASGERININTKIGYLNGVSILGNTVQNMCDYSIIPVMNEGKYEYTDGIITNTSSIDHTNWINTLSITNSMKKNETYSLIVKSECGEQVEFQYALDKPINQKKVIRINPFDFQIESFTAIDKNLFFKFFSSNENTPNTKIKLMILEGDWTNRPIPDFFEGIKSIGEISEHKTFEKIDPIIIKSFSKNTTIVNDSIIPANINIESVPYKKEVFLKPSTKYELKLIKNVDGDLNIFLCGLSATLNNKHSSASITTPATLKDREYLTFSGWGDVEKVMLTEGKTSAIYTDGFGSVAQDEKLEILTSDDLDNNVINLLAELSEPLRRVEDSYDSIEMYKGEWCEIRRTMEISPFIKDLGFNVGMWPQYITNTHLSFYIFNHNVFGTYKNSKINTEIKCNLFNRNDAVVTKSYESYDSANYSNPPYVAIRVLKDRLKSNDVDGIIDFIKRYNVKFVIGLKDPIITPLNKTFSLETFNRFTKIFSSNNVKPIITASIPTNLGAVIKNDVERISRIEDTIDKVLLPSIIDADHDSTLISIDCDTIQKW